MTPEEMEAEKAHDAYRLAIMALGAKVVVQTLADFQSVTVGNAESFAKYAAASAALIYRFRKQSRDLAMSLYQYERALLTGEAIKDWAVDKHAETVGELRDNFNSQLRQLGVQPLPRTSKVNLTVRVKWTDSPQMRKEERIRERLLNAEIDTTMEIIGQKRLERARLKAERAQNVASMKKISEDARKEVQANLAHSVERIALDGARDLDNNVIRFDKKLLGYTRIHDPLKQDTPCGWCSMLMTRGFTSASGLYTKETAGAAPGEEGFHASCHCTVVKVYTKAQLSSDKFRLNRQYAEQWPRVTSGHYGKDALTAWRKHMREIAKSNPAKNPDKAALEAA